MEKIENAEYPILEFDEDRNVFISPLDMTEKIEDMPKICVMCFFEQAIQTIIEEYEHEIIGQMKAESIKAPIYKVNYNGTYIALVSSWVGGPLAVGQIEELSAMGAEKFLIVGSCRSVTPRSSKRKINNTAYCSKR